jgi:hypothetical protein
LFGKIRLPTVSNPNIPGMSIMASGSRYPKPTLDRQGDTRILTIPVWRGKSTFVFIILFTFLLLSVWIHGFLQPLLSEWSGAQPTLSAGQKVSGWIWTLVLIGLPYSALYQWKGRLVLIAGPDRLLRVRDMVLFRIRREYLGTHIRNLRWSMPEKMNRPLGMQAVKVVDGSVLCDYEGRTVMLTGVLSAEDGKPLVDALAQVYAKAPGSPAEASLEPAKAPLPSRTDIQDRNGTLRILRSGRNIRLAGFLTLFFAGWVFFEIILLLEVRSDLVSTARAVAQSGDLFPRVMMWIFLAFWSLMSLAVIPYWLFNMNGREELELDEAGMRYRKRFILFSYSRRFPRQALSNIRITDTGFGRYESADDRQTRAFWGESSLALAYDVSGKTKRIFVGASRQECDAIAKALARYFS